MKDDDIRFIPPPEAPTVFQEHLKEAILGMMGIPAHLLTVSKRPIGNVVEENTMIERRVVKKDALDGTVVVWEKFENDGGFRWIQVKDSHTATYKDGDSIDPGNIAHLRGETSDRDEAVAWCRSGKEQDEKDVQVTPG